MRIEIMTGSPVTELAKNHVKIAGKSPQTIHTNTLVWATGVKSNELLDSLNLEKDRIGRIKVDEYLGVIGHHGVYAVGDCASFRQKITSSLFLRPGRWPSRRQHVSWKT